MLAIEGEKAVAGIFESGVRVPRAADELVQTEGEEATADIVAASVGGEKEVGEVGACRIQFEPGRSREPFGSLLDRQGFRDTCEFAVPVFKAKRPLYPSGDRV